MENVDERCEKLLKGVSPVDRLRLRDVDDAKAILDAARSTVYRWAAQGFLPHVKVAGKERRGRGRAGLIRFRLGDLVRFTVEREIGSTAGVVPASRSRVEADLSRVSSTS